MDDNTFYTEFYLKMGNGELYSSFGFDHKLPLTPEVEEALKGHYVNLITNTLEYEAHEIEFISKEEYDEDAEPEPIEEIRFDVKSKTDTLDN